MMTTKITSRLNALSVGCVATLWDLMVYRLSEDRWIVGRNSIRLTDTALCLSDAADKFENLLD